MITVFTLSLAFIVRDAAADVVIARILAERAKVQTWHIALSVRTVQSQRETAKTAARYEVWRDGARGRTECKPLDGAPALGWGHYEREFVCDGCWPTAGRLVRATLPQTPVEHFPVGGRHETNLLAIDVRKIGLLPESLFGHADTPIDEVLRKVPLTVVEPAPAGGLVVLSGKHPTVGFTMRVSVDPNQGYCVTAIDGEGVMPKPHPPTTWRKQTRVTPARDPATGLWYVRESVFEEWSEGKSVCKQTIALDVAELNQPIDPRVFTMTGLDIPVGKGVRAADTGKYQYWDGNRVVDDLPPPPAADVVRPTAAPPEPVGGRPTDWARWLGIPAAVAFAVAAVFLLRRAVRRRTG